MKTKLWAVLLMLLTSLMVALALFFLKLASNNLVFSVDIIFNYWIYLGLITLAIGAVFMILAFKGGNVSVLYPLMATSYIWMTFLGIYFFHENVSVINWIGIIFISIGVGVIGSISKK